VALETAFGERGFSYLYGPYLPARANPNSPNRTAADMRSSLWTTSGKLLLSLGLVAASGLVIAPAIGATAGSAAVVAAPQPGGDWPTYLHDVQRSAANTDASALSVASAPKLTRLWKFTTGGTIAASPSVVGGVVYIGSWDGNEYALDAATGALKWKTFLGVTHGNSTCVPATAGVTSSATVQSGVVYVGGGDSNWYALDAATGNVLWTVPTGDNSASGGHYNWASPLIANGFAYIGIASLGDCPLVPGKLLKVSLSTHAVVATWNAVPAGRIGGGIWTSPALDPVTNTIFLSTGTERGSPPEPLAQAIVALDENSLSLKSVWKLPPSAAVIDSDFGTTPLLFTDSAGRALVGSVNKNGLFYAFLRSNIGAGPVWQKSVAPGGPCPQCGDGSVSSGAFANGAIFQAAGRATIGGTAFNGSVRSLNPATGSFNWQHGAATTILAAIAYTNGLVIDSTGSKLEVLNASTGVALFTAQLAAGTDGPPSVANGTIFASDVAGNVYAYAPPAAAGCPVSWGCADVGAVSVAGTQSLSGSTWTVQGAGTNIIGTADQFHFVWQSLAANGGVSARVVTQQNTNPLAKAAVMLRATTDAASPFYALLMTPGNGVLVQYRDAKASNAHTPVTIASKVPAFLRVGRSGNTFTAYTSKDGVSWTAIAGSSHTLSAFGSSSALAGMAVTSHNASTLSTVTFDHVSIG
jgi:outer membrane protein assembly factor BamB